MNNVRSSRFFKWIILYVIIFVICISAYSVIDTLGYVDLYLIKVRGKNSEYVILNFFLIFFAAIIYGMASLYNLLSHKAAEDSREHCLPIILAPFFLIVENGLVHAFKFADGDPYYEIIMGIFSTAALGVITFASLKFSFGISVKHNRLIETSDAKPDIRVKYSKKGKLSVTVQRKECYLCGAYVGKINKIRYWDVKRTGTYFEMSNLFFPNIKKLLTIGENKIDLSELDKTAPVIKNELLQGDDVYLILRDIKNYYYFAQIPMIKDYYNVIGINEPLMERLVYKHSLKREKCRQKIIKYTAMDWFNIPYNFHPKYR